MHTSPIHTYSTARRQLRIYSSPKQFNKIPTHAIHLESLIDTEMVTYCSTQWLIYKELFWKYDTL